MRRLQVRVTGGASGGMKGAVIGDGAGACVDADKGDKAKKKADQARRAYEMEYQHCMKSKGF